MQKADKIQLLAIIVLVGFFVAAAFHYCLAAYFDFGYPLSTFLHDPSYGFTDLLDLIPYIKALAPYSVDTEISYLPFNNLILYPLTLFPHKSSSLAVFFLLTIAYLFTMNFKYFSCENLTKMQNFQNIFILTMLAYPNLVILDRANCDIFVLMIMLPAILYLKENRYMLSAIIFGVVNAIKPYSLIFYVLFLFKKRFKEIFFGLLMIAFLTVLSLAIFKVDFFTQILLLIRNLKIFEALYIVGDAGFEANSSLFCALKIVFVKLFKLVDIQTLRTAYTLIKLTVMAVVLGIVYIDKVFWRKIALITLFIIAFSVISFDYKLIFLYIPLWLFVSEEETGRFDVHYIIMFGILMIPKLYLIFEVDSWHKMTIQSIINPTVMVLFMALIVFDVLFSLKKEKDCNLV